MWKPAKLLLLMTVASSMTAIQNDTQLAIRSMEYIHFARPDLEYPAGVNVHSRLVREWEPTLAREFKHEADIVVGVPNSSLSAAMGFAKNQFAK